jgi:hypothetical protein
MKILFYFTWVGKPYRSAILPSNESKTTNCAERNYRLSSEMKLCGSPRNESNWSNCVHLMGFPPKAIIPLRNYPGGPTEANVLLTSVQKGVRVGVGANQPGQNTGCGFTQTNGVTLHMHNYTHPLSLFSK